MVHGAPSVTGEPPRSSKQRTQRRLDGIVREHAAHAAALPAARALAIVRAVGRAIDEAHAQGRPHGGVSLAAIAVEDRTGRVFVAPPRGGGDRDADRAALVAVAEELVGKDVVARASPSCAEAQTALAAVAALYRARGVDGPAEDRPPSSHAGRVLRVVLLDPDSARQADAIRAVTAVYGSRVRVRTTDDEADAPELVIVDGDRGDAADVVAELRLRAGGDRLRVVAAYVDPERSRWSLSSLGVIDIVRHDDVEGLKAALRAIGVSSGWRVRATSTPPSERRRARPEPLEEVEDEPSPHRRRRRASSRSRAGLVPGLVVFAVASSAILLAMVLIARGTGRRFAPAPPPPAAGQRTR